jgi:phosphatidate cytidylyltransferase
MGLAIALIALGFVVPMAATWGKQSDLRDHYARLRSWTMVAGSLMLALALGPLAIALLFGWVAAQGMREWLRLLPDPLPRPLVVVCQTLAVVLPLVLWVGHAGGVALPTLLDGLGTTVLLVTPLLVLALGSLQQFVPQLGMVGFGLSLCVWSPCHAMALGLLAEPAGERGGRLGLLLFAVLVGDAMQYVAGKLLGRHKLAPVLSPKKTWEGLLGGAALTGVLVALAAPQLLHVPALAGFVLGLLATLAGFVGDVTVSAVKRWAGIKDTGTLLPGMGGLLDRTDSLTLAAPLWWHLLGLVGG